MNREPTDTEMVLLLLTRQRMAALQNAAASEYSPPFDPDDMDARIKFFSQQAVTLEYLRKEYEMCVTGKLPYPGE